MCSYTPDDVNRIGTVAVFLILSNLLSVAFTPTLSGCLLALVRAEKEEEEVHKYQLVSVAFRSAVLSASNRR